MPRKLYLQNLLMNQATGGEGEGGAQAGAGGGSQGDDGKSGSEGDDEGAKGDTGDKGKGGDELTETEKALQKEKADLLKEVMKKKEALADVKEQLKAFDGIDPEQVRALLAKEADAEKAAKAAEEKSLEEKGEWDRLKQMMAEQHDAALSERDSEIQKLKSQLTDQSNTIEELTVGSAFNGSEFIGEELTLTPAKARIIFGSNFEVVEGQVVAYDKPTGAKDRTPLVDERGQSLNFEASIRKLVDADPDRDSLIRARIQKGSGSKPGSSSAPADAKGKSSLEKIAAGLSDLTKS